MYQCGFKLTEMKHTEEILRNKKAKRELFKMQQKLIQCLSRKETRLYTLLNNFLLNIHKIKLTKGLQKELSGDPVSSKHQLCIYVTLLAGSWPPPGSSLSVRLWVLDGMCVPFSTRMLSTWQRWEMNGVPCGPAISPCTCAQRCHLLKIWLLDTFPTSGSVHKSAVRQRGSDLAEYQTCLQWLGLSVIPPPPPRAA